jgi:LPXTG-motif cell wall-anchored protein
MPARPSITALAAALALAAPASALGQDEPGAGDSQYSDPFAPPQTQTQTQPAQPPAPTPDHEAGDQGQAAPAQTEPVPDDDLGVSEPEIETTPAQTSPAQTLPRTGFDVLPVAAAGLLLLLGGLALRRRPHGER